MNRLSSLLPLNADSLADMIGVASIGLATVGILWLPALFGG